MKKLQLTENGKAMLPIVLPKDSVELKTAAAELTQFVCRVSGAELETAPSAPAPAITLAIDASLGEEEYAVVASEAGLSFRGGGPRGVLYGVYAFLEEELGIGFYAHDTTKIPRKKNIKLGDIRLRGKPALEYRQIDYPPCMHADWRAHNRINSGEGLENYGGSKTYSLFVHTFDTLVPSEEYFDGHPEYFSMVDGERRRGNGKPDVGTQLCLTNPEVVKIATESVRRISRERPGATIVSVSQNDCYFPCDCPECARVDAEEGSRAGTLIRFVNAIAEAIEPEFPNLLVDTLAYQYTRTPPKITKPRHNVCVRLCSIECCFGHPLESCNWVSKVFANKDASKQTFQEDLIGWGKICDRVYIWDYTTNYNHYWMPFPNFHVLGPNLRFFVRNGVKGVYEQGNYQSVSPDLTELRTWLVAKLLWNPEFDVKEGIREFTDCVYGDAAPHIRDYIELLERRVVDGNIHFDIMEHPPIGYLDRDTLAKAQKLVKKALKKDLTFTQRVYVEKFVLSVEYAEVGLDIRSGTVDRGRIDAVIEKSRTLGITRITQMDFTNDQLRFLMLDGKLFADP